MLAHFFKTIEKITPQKWRWIFNHEGFKRYFANTGWMFLGQMFSLLISFFIGAWLARYLGPENYGVLSYAVAFVGLFGFIASLGVDGVLNRELVAHPEKRDELMGTAFFMKITGGVLAMSVSILAIYLSSSSSIIKLLVILFSFNFILQSFNVISIYFQAEVRAKKNVRAQLIAAAASAGLKIAIIFLGKGVIWLIFVYLLEALFYSVGLVVSYSNHKLKLINWTLNKRLVKILLHNSWPLMLATVASSIYMRIDQIMIGWFLGAKEVGLYSVSVKIAEVWNFIPGIICTSLFPAIINAKKSDKIEYKRRLKHLYLLMLVLAVFIAVIITLSANPIINLLFGSDYFDSVNILRIYIWSGIGIFLGIAVTQQLLSENSVKTIFVLNISAMLINIVLNFIFIPKFGLLGAAWATLISYFILPIPIFLRNKIINI